jgi:hypothetical protein
MEFVEEEWPHCVTQQVAALKENLESMNKCLI